jgi:hypothetical protein
MDGSIRKVVVRSHKGFRGWFFSRHSGKIPFESLIERDFLTRLAAHPDVRSIVSQPEEIYWHDRDGIAHRHVPDFAFSVRGEQWIAEIKPAAKIYNPRKPSDCRILERTAVLTQQYRQEGIRYGLFTDHAIRTEPHLENARTLLRGAHEVVTDNEVNCASAIAQSGSTPRDIVAQSSIPLLRLYAMILDGHLAIANPSSLFGPDSLIYARGCA